MKALVTGGGGFLGRRIVEMLAAEGHEVLFLARGAYPEVAACGATGLQHDLRQRAGLDAHLAGVDCVFHVASVTGVWGERSWFFDINVQGTRNLMDAAVAAGVPRFVYTSSPSVTFDGRDHVGATEADCPYPSTFEAFYPESKAVAEREVLAENGRRGMATTALRPHLIWGPRDPHLLPRVIQRRRQGRLRVVGTGENKVGLTHVDNGAVAHLQAAAALVDPEAPNAGKAYFITDLEPVALWPWLDAFLQAVGERPIQGKVSVATARRVGSVLEWIWGTLGLGGEPPMTRFVAAQLGTSHWYDLSAAIQDFGYAPVVDPAEALAETIEAFRGAQVVPR